MDVETQMQQIQERNRRVELDKAWETSLTRRSFIAAITYVLAVVFLISIGNPNPYLSALIPVGGYLISTLALPFIRHYWEKRS